MSYLDFDFPHTRYFESDLRELIKQVFIMNDLVTNFVSINAIKYANPIQWDITRNYEKNTVVIDGNSGVAYISVRPVPAGIALTREQYWTKVFDLSVFITKGAANFARSYEEQPTTTATMTTDEGEWLVWDTTLYKALTNIHPGDRYVVDGNIKRMTVEDFYDVLKSIIDNEIHEREAGDDALELALNEEIEIRGEADGALHQEIVQESVDRENADNSLQDTIDAEIAARENADGDLAGLTTVNKNNLVSAINEVNTTGGGAIAKIGNLNDLVTSAKSNIVSAINETFNINDYQDVVGVKQFGAKCDGVTDDSDAFINAINACEGKVLVINGDMKISKPIPITHPIIIRGNSHTIYTASNFNTTGGLIGERQVFLINGANGVKIENLTINCINTANINSGILINNSSRVELNGIHIFDTLGVAVWIRADNQYINLNKCYAYHCDKNVRLNGGGAFSIALGGGGVANHYIYFNECVAKSCGNAGFCTYDADHVVITGCSAIDMQGGSSGREWEVGDGFMLGSNTIIANCFATQIMNAAYYVTGDNNMLIGCNAYNCGGMAIDLYTGGHTAFDNTIVGLTVNNCGLTPHLDMYPSSTLIAGTKQYRMVMSDVNICGGGNNSAPVNAIALDEPAECMISNVRMTDITNINDGIQFGGGQNGNIVQNCKIQGKVNIAQYNQYTVLRNIDNQKPYEEITLSNTEWTNHTHFDVMAYITGTGITTYLNNVDLGDTHVLYVPHNAKLGCTGTVEKVRIIKL